MFTKLAALLLTLIVGAIPAGRDSRPMGQVLSRALDVAFSHLLCLFIATRLGVFTVKPLESRGYAAIPDLLALLFVLFLKAIAFVVAPAVVLAMFLRSIPGFGWRIAIYGLFAAAGLTTHYVALERNAAERRAEESAVRAEKSRRAAEGAAEQSMAEAYATAGQREQQRIGELSRRYGELAYEAQKRWRADIEAAGAIGEDAGVPPMLRVDRFDAERLRITNLGPRRACVSIARVFRRRGDAEYQRCPLDTRRECQELAVGRPTEWVLLRDLDNTACASGWLEFRVGKVLRPEPSWWSRSALVEFDRSAPDPRLSTVQLPEYRLVTEVAELEKILSERDRAARWRDELANAQ